MNPKMHTKKLRYRLLPVFTALCLTAAGSAAGYKPAAASTAENYAAKNSFEKAVPFEALNDVLAVTNDRHRNYQKPQVNLEDHIVSAEGSGFDFHEYTVDWSKEVKYDGSVSVTREQAAKDLDILFSALSTTYSPYYYFGGDKTFGAAKETILEACGEKAKSGKLTAKDVTDLIRENLSFIRDAHFQVNFEGMHQLEVPYLYSGALFDRTAEVGYVSRDGGRVLKSVDGRTEYESLLRMTLTGSGEVAYCPVVLRERDEEKTPPADLTLRFTDGGSVTVSPDPWESWYDDNSGRTIDLTYRDGYPVVFVRNMGFDEAKDDTLGKEFLAYAEQLKDEPVVILDLRSNGGGNGILPKKWLKIWTGEAVTSNSVGLISFSQQDLDTFVANTDNIYYNSREDFVEVDHMRPVNEQYMSMDDVPDKFVENDKLLIVLTGKNTASAAETFTDTAMNVENTVIIGENTAGMMISNAYATIQLPNSGTMITLGCNLMFHPEETKEYIGIMPDIWVNGDAEEKALGMLKNLSVPGGDQ